MATKRKRGLLRRAEYHITYMSRMRRVCLHCGQTGEELRVWSKRDDKDMWLDAPPLTQEDRDLLLRAFGDPLPRHEGGCDGYG